MLVKISSDIDRAMRSNEVLARLNLLYVLPAGGRSLFRHGCKKS